MKNIHTKTLKEIDEEIRILTEIRLERRKKGEGGQNLRNYKLEQIEEFKKQGYLLALQNTKKILEKINVTTLCQIQSLTKAQSFKAKLLKQLEVEE